METVGDKAVGAGEEVAFVGIGSEPVDAGTEIEFDFGAEGGESGGVTEGCGVTAGEVLGDGDRGFGDVLQEGVEVWFFVIFGDGRTVWLEGDAVGGEDADRGSGGAGEGDERVGWVGAVNPGGTESEAGFGIGVDAPSDSGVRFEDGDGVALIGEGAGSGESSDSGSDDDNAPFWSRVRESEGGRSDEEIAAG